MTTIEHKTAGHVLVPHMGFNVGNSYTFGWEKYRIVEICEDDLADYCWIERDDYVRET